MQLTYEEKRKVFAMYLDATVTASHPQSDNAGETLTGYLTGIHGEYQAEVQHLEDGNVWEHPEYHDFDVTKLQLIPLTKLTDAHAVQLAKLLIDGEQEMKLVARVWDTVLVFEDKISTTGHSYIELYDADFEVGRIKMDEPQTRSQLYNCAHLICLAFQFLTQENYAVPLFFGANHWANGKTAIELELAIDKSNLKVTSHEKEIRN